MLRHVLPFHLMVRVCVCVCVCAWCVCVCLPSTHDMEQISVAYVHSHLTSANQMSLRYNLVCSDQSLRDT
jgi:hypothetical protein